MGQEAVAGILVSIVSPLLGLLLVSLIFWLNKILNSPPEKGVVIIVTAVYAIAWGIGIFLLRGAINKYSEAGILSGSDRGLLLIFVGAVSLVVAVQLIIGYLVSRGRTPDVF